MNTQQLCEALQKKAIDEKRSNYEHAAKNFKTLLKIGDSPISVSFSSKEGNEVVINSDDLLETLIDTLIDRRKESICAQEIKMFMRSVENFRNHVQNLDDYI